VRFHHDPIAWPNGPLCPVKGDPKDTVEGDLGENDREEPSCSVGSKRSCEFFKGGPSLVVFVYFPLVEVALEISC